MLMQRMPAPPLRPFIKSLWISEPAPMSGKGGALLEHVLPSGEMVRALHPAVAQALQGIGRMQRVDALVRESGYSHRQFVALFRRAVGLPPKAYARVLRFQSALKQAHAMARLNRPVPWADLALQAGYSDQAHFSREFRAMAGVTPEAYRKQASAHANHLGVAPSRK